MGTEGTPDGEGRVVGFASFDEMLDWMTQRDAEADAAMVDVQRELVADADDDRYWIRPYATAGCFIFGVAWGRERLRSESMKHVPPTPDADAPATVLEDHEVALAEAQSEIRHYDWTRQEKNLLFGDCYSVLCPEGELGQTHAVNVWPISKEAFDEAREHDWEIAIQPEGGERDTPLVVGELMAMEVARATHKQGGAR